MKRLYITVPEAAFAYLCANTNSSEMTVRVMKKYRERLNQFIDNEGRHLNHVVFKF
jgi:hypothetical protein